MSSSQQHQFPMEMNQRQQQVPRTQQQHLSQQSTQIQSQHQTQAQSQSQLQSRSQSQPQPYVQRQQHEQQRPHGFDQIEQHFQNQGDLNPINQNSQQKMPQSIHFSQQQLILQKQLMQQLNILNPPSSKKSNVSHSEFLRRIITNRHSLTPKNLAHITKIIHSLPKSDSKATQTEKQGEIVRNYETLLQILSSSLHPIPESSFTHAQIQALRLQITAAKLLVDPNGIQKTNQTAFGQNSRQPPNVISIPPKIMDLFKSMTAVGKVIVPPSEIPFVVAHARWDDPLDPNNIRRIPFKKLPDQQNQYQSIQPGGGISPAPLDQQFLDATKSKIKSSLRQQELKALEHFLGVDSSNPNPPGLKKEDQQPCTKKELDLVKIEPEAPPVVSQFNTADNIICLDTVLDKDNAQHRLRCQIRLHALRLLSLQKSLRNAIINESHIAAKDGTLGSYRREKKNRAMKREVERLERVKAKREETEERERKKKAHAWCVSLMDHHAKFRQYHRDQVKRYVRVMSKAVIKYHEEHAKIVNKEEREEEKRRIQKLKEDDEEGYLELVRQSKNTRLMELLNKTDQYLKELGAVVRDERKRQNDREEQIQSDDEEDDNKNYYDMAHKFKEKITQQAHMLKGGDLKEYQLQGIQWMVSLYNNRLNGILADEMGLGKTIQTIGLIGYLMEHKFQRGPFFVCVPLSTISNWELEFKRWLPDAKVLVFKGDKKKRKELYENVISEGDFNVLLCTFEYAVRGKSYLSRVYWIYVIVDEGHRIKNHESKLALILGKEYKSRNRLLLTGTPLQNSLQELWALLNFLLPTVFASVDTFEGWFSAPLSNMGATAVEDAALTEEESLLIIRRLHQVLRPFLLRRLKADVLKMGEQLPTKQEDIILCDMSEWQKHLYFRVVKNEKVVHTDKNYRRRYAKLSNPTMQLKKIVNHPYVFYEDYAEAVPNTPELWRCSGKFNYLDGCVLKLLKAGHRILIFNQMTKILDLQERLLNYRGIPFLRLDGSTKAEDRRDLVKEFNSPETKYHVFLLTTRAGGLGVNLQTADTVIIFDSDWNPQADLQAQDRAHRIGQKHEVRVLRFITARSIEEDVLEKASFKRGLEQKIIQAGMFDETSKDSERQAMLRELLRLQEANSDGENEELPSLEDLNRILARDDREFELFGMIDTERSKEIKYLPPLMTEEEVPRWVIHPKSDEIYGNPELGDKDENDMLFGSRRRAAAKNVVYNLDNLTDDQYMKLLDSKESDDENESKKRKNESDEETERYSSKRQRTDDRSDLDSTTVADQSSTHKNVIRDDRKVVGINELPSWDYESRITFKSLTLEKLEKSTTESKVNLGSKLKASLDDDDENALDEDDAVDEDEVKEESSESEDDIDMEEAGSNSEVEIVEESDVETNENEEGSEDDEGSDRTREIAGGIVRDMYEYGDGDEEELGDGDEEELGESANLDELQSEDALSGVGTDDEEEWIDDAQNKAKNGKTPIVAPETQISSQDGLVMDGVEEDIDNIEDLLNEDRKDHDLKDVNSMNDVEDRVFGSDVQNNGGDDDDTDENKNEEAEDDEEDYSDDMSIELDESQ